LSISPDGGAVEPLVVEAVVGALAGAVFAGGVAAAWGERIFSIASARKL